MISARQTTKSHISVRIQHKEDRLTEMQERISDLRHLGGKLVLQLQKPARVAATEHQPISVLLLDKDSWNERQGSYEKQEPECERARLIVKVHPVVIQCNVQR